MQLLKRIGYYLIGVGIGSVGVLYFWKNKKVSFDYGPNARTLKSIRIKERFIPKNIEEILIEKNIDTSYISTILMHGNVIFDKSKPRLKPCAEYFVSGKDSLKHISLYIVRCDSTAILKNIFFK
ncbi:MAG: DUF4258 domain-containing protein [Tenacibaculum sp.]